MPGRTAAAGDCTSTTPQRNFAEYSQNRIWGGAKVLVKFLSAKEDLPAAGQVCDTVAFSGALLAKRRLLHAIRSTDRGAAIDLQTAHWLCCASSYCLGVEPQ